MNEHASAAGCRNTIIVIVALALVGFYWAIFVPHDSPVFARMVGATSGFILMLTVYGIVVNVVAIVDWFRVRRPPVVEHPILGTLRYWGMRWHGEARGIPFSFEGRRMGPGEDSIAALAFAIEHFEELTAKGRALASPDAPESIGMPAGIWAYRESSTGTITTEWSFPLPKDEDRRVRVIFRGDEPVEAELI